MKTFNVLLAKSWLPNDSDQIPPYAKLVPHISAVRYAGVSIVDVVGEIILQNLGLPKEPWLSRLYRSVEVGCLSHDIGKANEGFQLMVMGQLSPKQQPARHELLSALLLLENPSIRKWALDLLSQNGQYDDAEILLNCVIGAVGGHHIKLDDEWKKAVLALQGGCGTSLSTLLTHPDLKALFRQQLLTKEIVFSLIEGDDNDIRLSLNLFRIHSNKWKLKLKKDPEWHRFAGIVKALVMAADVAGSAMLPEKENIKKWIYTTLSQLNIPDQIKDVVKARLKGKPPRPFQLKIKESFTCITIVEAGCGTGKTAAAYLWAQHHAKNKKLFFCYPTTGTATEGFLGYVHESDIEAKLMHSRAIVDLQGLAKVNDEDIYDNLLRIDSLNAWSPQVVVCTVDTVLALVCNNRQGLYNSPAILSAAFVFDELHSYTERMFEKLIALMKALPGASFLLMSASLQKSRKTYLLNQFSDISEIESDKNLESIPRYQFELSDNLEKNLSLVKQKVAQQQKVLWICNTVSRTQGIYEKLLELGVRAETYHSRFKYSDRKDRHTSVISKFDPEKNSLGFVAVTTQVAEMSLDLDADLLISELAPIPSLIQRLGRLNRRVTVENPGSPRKAIFLPVPNNLPYETNDLAVAECWINNLINLPRPLSQRDLSNEYQVLVIEKEEKPDTRSRLFDYGWFAEAEPIREIDSNISVILPEDIALCRENKTELINKAIPMYFSQTHQLKGWEEFCGHFIPPENTIDYDKFKGAQWSK